MDKPSLLHKLEAMLDEFARGHAWGNIEVEIRDGVPNMIRKTVNEKLIAQETTRAGREYR